MSYNSVIRSSDPNAVKMLNENIDHIQGTLDYMRTVNEHYTAHGTTVGCPNVDFETARELDARVNDEQEKPYPDKFFIDNRSRINTLQRNINRIEDNPQSLYQGWRFAGGEAVVNLANNRLQLMFDSRPSEKQIAVMKTRGFRWASKAQAWQSALSPRTFAAADKIDFIKSIDGKKPSEIQPKMPKRDAPER